eukprot:Gregarina_sp_Pseudo_9__1293@NODE_1861_length_1290_cov_7_842526_g1727_i0_p1_GENE_NODE_1861_length_1290_cov_7_842526_g1727_i0NODE_1861_length_1290_cov_7_842526_g1727_i0_p1_ORF_typecomplete_len411_score67_11DUF1269/PF06897_12/1_5e05DUF3482/PF11981_8/2_6e03DUF3482/PF11981_8/0_0037DUF456/PF04306_13/0_0016Glyzipper_Omp/PF13488_6/0_0022DUF3472/PF11958_8/0_034SNARE_assoc/PF09335_11/0_032Glyzipper_YMGG/PF13441_6/0_18TraT/PF05818_12/0_29YtxH/PF12732_7/1e04YtxH/PF12732_7/4e03YtxH/PF12732_7/9_5e02YtxH/PF127
MNKIEISSQLCRGLCYYLYLKRFGIILDTDSVSNREPVIEHKLWDCIEILDLDPAQSVPLRNVVALVKNLKTTLVKAQDKCNAVDSIISYAESVGYLDTIECRALLQSLLDLLRVSATLYIQIAIQFENPENIEMIKQLPNVFPTRADFGIDSTPWLEEFADVPFSHWNDSVKSDPRRCKLRSEALSLEELFVELMERFYAIQKSDRVKASRQGATGTGRHAQVAIQWDLETTLKEAEKRELVKIQEDLQMMHSLQAQFSSQVDRARDPLDSSENNLNSTRIHTQESSLALVNAARARSRTWTLEGGALGVVCGAITGLLAGPVGAVIGGAAGGALGTMTGQALRSRKRQQLNRVEQNLSRRGDAMWHSGETDDLVSAEERPETAPREAVMQPRTIAGCAGMPVTFYPLR